jgi:hypothetical protein
MNMRVDEINKSKASRASDYKIMHPPKDRGRMNELKFPSMHFQISAPSWKVDEGFGIIREICCWKMHMI